MRAFLDRCVARRGGANERTFVRANTALLDRIPAYPRAAVVSEFSIDHGDHNGCPEGLGPATSFTTYRNYRLPRGARGVDVTRWHERRLRGWTRSRVGGRCERVFTRGDTLLAVRACSTSLVVTARALAPKAMPPPPPLPPRPTGDVYPVTPAEAVDAEAADDVVEPGTTCERSRDAPAILPPPPGLRAELQGAVVVVEWSLGTVRGDCPPATLLLSVHAHGSRYPPYTIREQVHESSGTTRVRLPDVLPRPTIVRASAYSVDGHRSRLVGVRIRR